MTGVLGHTGDPTSALLSPDRVSRSIVFLLQRPALPAPDEFRRHQIVCNPTTMSKNFMVLSISTRHQPCARVAVLHAWRRRGTSSALGGARR